MKRRKTWRPVNRTLSMQTHMLTTWLEQHWLRNMKLHLKEALQTMTCSLLIWRPRSSTHGSRIPTIVPCIEHQRGTARCWLRGTQQTSSSWWALLCHRIWGMVTQIHQKLSLPTTGVQVTIGSREAPPWFAHLAIERAISAPLIYLSPLHDSFKQDLDKNH